VQSAVYIHRERTSVWLRLRGNLGVKNQGANSYEVRGPGC
jgi:hypothetical protein